MKRQGILVIMGQKGSGKTELIRRFLDSVPRSVVIDTQNEYGGVRIRDARSLSKYLNDNDHDGQGKFRVAFQPSGQDDIDVSQVFKMLHHLRDAWLGVEEASKWMGSHLGRADRELVWFVQYGRHNRISQLYIARRPSELDRNVTANADVVVSFKQHEPRDLQYIRDIGGPEAAERVAALGMHEWDYVRRDHDEVVEILDAISEESSGGDVAASGADAEPRDGDISATPDDAPAEEDPSNADGGQDPSVQEAIDVTGRAAQDPPKSRKPERHRRARRTRGSSGRFVKREEVVSDAEQA